MINVVIISELSCGGVEKVNTVLAKYLDRKYFHVTVISMVTAPEKFENIKLPFECVFLNSRKKKLALKKLVSTLKRLEPEVICTSCMVETYYAYLYKKLYKKNVKVIYAQHSVWTCVAGEGIKKKLLNFYLPKITNIFCKIDALVFVSYGVQTDFENVFTRTTPNKVVIYNPITDGTRFRGFRPIESGKIRVVTVGRLEQEKCQYLILEAVSLLNKRGYFILLDIFGEGSLKKKLQQQAESLGIGDKIYFHGYVTDVEAQIGEDDVFVLSSEYESFGNVLVEAMSVGLPVVSTDCPCGPTEILQDGKYGLLVPMKNSTAIADAVEQTIKQHDDIRVKAAYERSMDFSIEKSVHGYESLFKKLLED